ncbi:MAG: acyltransferase [Methanomassiliicoccus sp.]|nr:acyltransferase [Methanomassiliicoccus sp.]
MADPGKGWIKELNYMRAFAILGVVAIHAVSYSEAITGQSMIPPAAEYIAHLSDFAVPLFFIISGYILALRPLEPKDRGTFYRRRLLTVVPPYIFFSTVYLLYNYLIMGQTDLFQAAWSYLLFDTTGVFWFLGAMIQMYLLFPFLSIWLDRLIVARKAWKLPVYAGILYVAWWAVLLGATTDSVNALSLPTDNAGGRLAELLFPGYLLFFALGMYLARTPGTGLRSINGIGRLPMAVIVLAMPIGMGLMGKGSFLWAMVVVPYAILASSLVYRASAVLASRQGMISSLFEVLGRYSFGIYMVHILALAIVVNRLWAVGLFASDVGFYLLMYVGAIVVSVAILFIIDLFPYGTKVSGVRTKGGGRQRLRWWRATD